MGPLWLPLLASTSGALAADANWGAQITATARAGINECTDAPQYCRWIHFNDTAVVSPWVSAKPNDQVSAKAELDLRFHGSGSGYGLDSTTNQTPWSLRFRDAWVSARSDHTEIRLGVQRIAWGVAQGVSVVDTVNPLNLEDPTQLDQRLSTLSGVFTAHTETLSVTGLFVPFFVPAALPSVDVDLMASAKDIFDDRFTGGQAMELGQLESRPDIPINTLENASLGAQVRWTPPAGDFTLSWHSGRDGLPQVAGELRLLGYQTKQGRVDVGVPLAYPRLHTYGFTARRQLPAYITAWAEMALSVGQRTTVNPSKRQLEDLERLGAIENAPNPIPQTETQDGRPLLKWIAGADRPFGPVRLVGQWLHGFFTERSQDEINDYGLVGLRWNVTPIIRLDTNVATDLNGHLMDFGVTFLHADTAEITVAATHINGPDNSALGGLKAASNIRTGISMQF